MNLDFLDYSASVVTIFGFALVLWQQRIQSKNLEADIRAYLHVDVKKRKFDNKTEMLVLSIYNSGEVAAEGIFISTTKPGVSWFALRGDKPPEFTKTDSKLRVLPGEELFFLLGPQKDLPMYTNDGIEVEIRYRQIPGKAKHVVEIEELSLEPRRYLIERKLR